MALLDAGHYWMEVPQFILESTDEQPSAFYDSFSTDGLSTLYKRPLTNDHPANATTR